MGKKPFTPEQRERRRAYVKAWRAEHREHSPPANRNGEVPQSFTTLWASILRRADEQGRREALSDHGQDGTDGRRHTRASG